MEGFRVEVLGFGEEGQGQGQGQGQGRGFEVLGVGCRLRRGDCGLWVKGARLEVQVEGVGCLGSGEEGLWSEVLGLKGLAAYEKGPTRTRALRVLGFKGLGFRVQG